MINPEFLNTDKKYHEDTTHMSTSKWKRFEKCEYGALQPWGEPTDSMLVGSYVDAYFTGDIEQFKVDHPDIISSRGATKGQLKYNFRQADEIIEYIENSPTFMKFLSGEKQVVMTGEIATVPFKIKIDSYSKGKAINDLKVMASVTNRNGDFYDFISQWGYDYQMAIYQEIVYQNTGEKLPTFICAVSKTTPINSVIVNIPQIWLDRALYQVESTVKHYWEVMQGHVEAEKCGICDYCVQSRTDTPIISYEDLVE